jgi:6-phosphogluconolactonase
VQPDLQVIDDPAGAAAELLAEAGGHVVLTGGSTPRTAYERAAAMRPDWSGVEVWFTDERCVPPDHEHSNYRLVAAALLDRVQGVEVHRMRGELGPHDGASAYERELGETGPEDFDLMLLGLGSDGHICSLFPGDDALAERERRVVGVEAAGTAPFVPRITLTLPVVNSTRQVVFLITGEGKADAVARVFSGHPDPRVPGSLVEGSPQVLMDAAAAARL